MFKASQFWILLRNPITQKAMPIIRQLTEAESDLATKDALVLQVGQATHHLAVTISETSDRFWSLPTERLLAVLNADVSASIATISANAALGESVNASLDALASDRFPTRATTTGRADITFDGTSFTYSPLQDDAPA